MQERRSLKPYLGTGYSTALESPLSQMITILEKDLVDIDTHYEGKTSLKNMHSKKQLVAVKSIFVEVNEILKFFTKGIKPGVLDETQIGYRLIKIQNIVPSFYTPAYSLFKILGKSTAMLVSSNNYVDQLSAAFEKINNQPISDENSIKFKKELKKQLEMNFSKYCEEICQSSDFDHKLFLNKLNAVIDSLDCETLNDYPEEKNRAMAFEKVLQEALFNTSGNALGDPAQKKYKKYQFQILDKKTYHFAMQILALIAQAPAEFKSLFSFFDPASIDNLGFSGLGQVKCINSNSGAKTPGYAFQITGDLTGTMQIDLAESYDSFIEGFSNQIAEEIAQYRENNSDLAFVKSELAKTRLIQNYIEKEYRNMSECAGMIIANRDVVLEQEINQERSISELVSWLKILKNINFNLAILKKKSNDFNSLNFDKLIEGEADLKLQLGSDKLNKYYTSYESKPIPEVLVYKDKNNKNARCEIRNYVFEEMINHRLLDSEEKLNQKIYEIEQIIQPKIQKLTELEINLHEQQNLSNEVPLQQIVVNAKANIKAKEYLFPDDLDEREKYITLEKKNLDQQINALNADYQNIQDFQATIGRQSKNCSSIELKECDATILKTISACYASSRAKTEQYIEELHQISKDLRANEAKLERELNTVKATIALNKTLQSSNPESIRILKEDKQQAREELLKEQALLLQEKALNQAKAEPDKIKEQAIAEKNEACQKTKKNISDQIGSIEKPLNDLSVEAQDIFKDKTFKTVEDVLKARIWLEGQMRSYNQAQTTAPKMINNRRLPKALRNILLLINKADAAQEPFPFEKLDAQLDVDFDTTFTYGKGFNLFLKQFVHSKEVSIWESYRGKNQLTPEFEIDKKALVARANDKLQEIDRVARIQDKLEIYTKNKSAIISLCDLLIRLEGETTEAINETTIYQNERLEKEKAFETTDLVLTERIAKNEKDLAAVTSNIEIFGQIESIMSNNQQLGRQICEIENLIGESNAVEKLNTARKEITDLFIQLEGKILQLEESMDILEQKIPREDKKIYEAYIVKLDNLIADSKARSKRIFNVLEANSQLKIEEIVTLLSKKIIPESGPILAAAKPDKVELLPWVINQTAKFKEISNFINQVLAEKTRVFQELNFDTTGELEDRANAQIGDLEEKAQAIIESIPTHLEAMVKPLADKFIAELAANSKLIEGNVYEAISYLSNFPLKDLNTLKKFFNETTAVGVLLTGITAEFASQVSRVNDKYSEQIAIIEVQIEAIKIDKTQSTYQTNKVKFEQITPKVDLLTETLSKQSPEHFEGIKQQMANLRKKYTLKHRDHELQHTRILARHTLAEKYKSEIDNYITARANSYSVKDRFFSGDKDEREKFSALLESELDNYVESANCKQLTERLKSSFSGYQLKPILNRLTLEFKKQNQPPEELRERVVGKKLEPIQNPAQKAKVDLLRAEIESIKSFSGSLDEGSYATYKAVANKLADSLSEGIDEFLLKYEILVRRNASSDERSKAFSEFQADFTCLLNSQNEVLSQHVSWGPKLANIGLAILAVCTAGASLGIQALVMKVALQRDSMWVRSEVISKVADMEEIAADIGRFNIL